MLKNLVLQSKGRRWLKKSYAQCGEDLIIKFIFDQIGIARPSYMDIGAHHPYYLSNTALFYELGSTGVNIEPDPVLFKQFTKYRKRDTNLNIGVGNDNGHADFYVISTPTLNTFSKEVAESYYKEGDYKITSVVNLPIANLSTVIATHCDNVFPQFLNVDAEGFDDLIVKALETMQSLPLVICIETISFSNSGNGVKNTDLITALINTGYEQYADTYINTIFIKNGLLKTRNGNC